MSTMGISVAECDWGVAKRGDIQALLADTASHIDRELRHPFDGRITVLSLPDKKRSNHLLPQFAQRCLRYQFNGPRPSME